ncbi:MAG: pyridoxamine 5'-phosphate oxidase family protein [Actinobacteria bacterium]|nr:pyridoxamine 5'-phosphate oxidase family protein [Actinomycetota bacterium]
MTRWDDVTKAAPDLAAAAQGRFEATGLGLLATLRKDGSPRISGIEPLFWDGDLWFGMMTESRKSADLRRDPRFGLHAATVDKDVKDGDAKIYGHAVEVVDAGEKARFANRLTEVNDFDPGEFDLWRADVTEVSSIRPGEPHDHLLIEWWHPGEAVHRHQRY